MWMDIGLAKHCQLDISSHNCLVSLKPHYCCNVMKSMMSLLITALETTALGPKISLEIYFFLRIQ